MRRTAAARISVPIHRPTSAPGVRSRSHVDVAADAHVETTGYRYAVAFGDDVPAPAPGDAVREFAALPVPDHESLLGALRPTAKIRAAASLDMPGQRS